MILPAAALLLLAAVLAARLRRPGTARVLVGLALAGWLATAEGPVARALLAPLQAGYLQAPAMRWASRNTIVVLGAGTVRRPPPATAPLLPGLLAYPRLVRAMTLYRDCRQAGRQCRILVSGGDPLQLGESEASSYGRVLRALGLPAEDLLEEERSLTTRQNAAYTAALLRGQPAGALILVSSAYHLRRARACFQAQGLTMQAVAADVLEPGPGLRPSSYNQVLSDLALHEWGGLLRDHVLVWLGRPL